MNWSYVAGYFDGEGTAGIYKYRKGSRAEISWGNTHEASLRAMCEFIGVGKVSLQKHRAIRLPHYKPMYYLKVCNRSGMLYVIERMLPYCLIKKKRLIEMAEFLKDRKDLSPNYGKMAKLGVEEVRRLYWDEKLSTIRIASRVGVCNRAVTEYMKRFGIPRRTMSEANRNVDHTTEIWQKRNEEIAQIRRRQWEDPAYRAKMSVAMRAGKTKSRREAQSG